jgi:hypothetical protein
VNGFSDYSPVGYLLAASVPLTPSAPIFISATASSIRLELPRAQDNGGSRVLSYQLWIDDGQNGDFAVVTEFD